MQIRRVAHFDLFDIRRIQNKILILSGRNYTLWIERGIKFMCNRNLSRHLGRIAFFSQRQLILINRIFEYLLYILTIVVRGIWSSWRYLRICFFFLLNYRNVCRSRGYVKNKKNECKLLSITAMTRNLREEV